MVNIHLDYLKNLKTGEIISIKRDNFDETDRTNVIGLATEIQSKINSILPHVNVGGISYSAFTLHLSVLIMFKLNLFKFEDTVNYLITIDNIDYISSFMGHYEILI